MTQHILTKILVFLLLTINGYAETQRVVHVCNWADYIGPKTIEKFEQETGIKVVYDVVESNEVLEAKLNTEFSGFDVVVPSTLPFFSRLKDAGIFMQLNLALLPNFKHMDQALLKRLIGNNLQELYCIPYLWGTTGIGFNRQKIQQLLPGVPLDSWAILFEPTIVEKLQDCGVSILDSTTEIFPIMQIYLGHDPHSAESTVFHAVVDQLKKIRPFIKKFHSFQHLNDLARGDVCLAQSWSGDVLRARRMAQESGNNIDIGYILPKEGSMLWADVLAIPKDAPHPEEAHIFINFMMQPEIIAEITEHLWYANANKTARQFISADILNNPVIYPPQHMMNKLHTDVLHPLPFETQRTRVLAKIILLNGQF